jgi:hypothetical protein
MEGPAVKMTRKEWAAIEFEARQALAGEKTRP